eukprot:5564011-Pyramimonas_sp.AAC.1
MGPPDAYIPIAESDVRMFCHDVLRVGHDKGNRTLAAFPPPALSMTAAHAARIDPWGGARLEVIVGEKYDPRSGGRDVWMLLYKGHLQ